VLHRLNESDAIAKAGTPIVLSFASVGFAPTATKDHIRERRDGFKGEEKPAKALEPKTTTIKSS
jgi:hypothetical protein